MNAFIELFREIWLYLKIRKKYWLAPLIFSIIFFGIIIVASQGSVIAPFIYTIF